MLVLPIQEARAGMTLVMTVTHPRQPDQELLKPGFVLDEPVIERLRELGVPFIYVDYPDLAELDRHLMPHLSPARQMVYGQIKDTIESVQKSTRPTVTFADYYVAMRELVITLMQQGRHPIYMDILSLGLGGDQISHSTAVAQLAVTLGIRLEQYLIRQRLRLPAHHAREVVNLGIAGMLHDIGKTRLPEHLQRYHAAMPPEKENDLREWETHSAIGREMLLHGVEPSAAAAVFQHHQHYDGSGFPTIKRRGRATKPMVGPEIHVFGRILAAADLYDRLTTTPDGRRRPPVEILHLLRTQYSARIDPYVLRAMPMVIPPFPPGSRVKLSDGTRAVVTALDNDDPYYPIVKRMEKDRWAMKGEPIHLADKHSLAIHSLEGVVVEHMIPAPAELRHAAVSPPDPHPAGSA